MREIFIVLLSVIFLGLTACERSPVIYNSFQESVDEEIASLDASDFTYTGSDNRDHITNDFTLPTTGREGTTITWTCSHPQYVTVSDGEADVIARPAYFEGDVKVTLTATVSVEGASGTTEIVVVVAAEEMFSETLKNAGDAAGADYFGCSVSISGDYAIVGACQDDDSIGDSGSAYIFERDTGGSWNQVDKLWAFTPLASGFFGSSVSISGSYAIVGAPGNDGAAYIFKQDGVGNWILDKSFGSYTGIRFGESVSISGNYAIVGAKNENTDGGISGAAFIFERDGGGSWNQVPMLKASPVMINARFGNSVSISGNYAIIGAYNENSGATNSGAAYIFERDGIGTWNQVKRLTPPAFHVANTNDIFGCSVSISGDYAIVGADYDDDGGTDSGAAYIFKRDADGNWNFVKQLIASDAQSGDLFGNSVSINREFAVVGAFHESDLDHLPSAFSENGAVYVFKRDDSGSWYEKKKIWASNYGSSDRFGYSVSISEDSVIVGADMEDSGAFDGGAVYILY